MKITLEFSTVILEELQRKFLKENSRKNFRIFPRKYWGVSEENFKEIIQRFQKRNAEKKASKTGRGIHEKIRLGNS